MDRWMDKWIREWYTRIPFVVQYKMWNNKTCTILLSLHTKISNAAEDFFLVQYIWLFQAIYRKNPKILDTRKFAVITLKVGQDRVSLS